MPYSLASQQKPNDNSPKEMLTFIIRRLYKKKCEREFYFSSQMANLLFTHGFEDQPKITKVRGSFKKFVEYKGTKFRFRLNQIYQAYPEIWGVEPESIPLEDEIVKAINHEISSVINRKEFLSVFNVSHVGTIDGNQVYTAYYNDDNEESQTMLPEGIMIDCKVDQNRYKVVLLEQNIRNRKVTWSVEEELPNSSKATLSASPEFLLKTLKKRIEDFDSDYIAFGNLFDEIIYPENLPGQIHYNELLSTSQLRAQNNCLNNDLSFIWGPPGTGKTHTLARVLYNLYLSNERTLVCSIANVAVDGTLKKFLELTDGLAQKGKPRLRDKSVLRIGFVTDEELLERDDIYPEDDNIRNLVANRERLLKQKSRIRNDSARYGLILSEINTLEEQIKNAIIGLSNNAQMHFCTLSKAILDEHLFDSYYDAIVIDEGSMVSPAYLYAICRKQPKRIIIAGDFRQLGPIAIGNSMYIDKWLKRSLFELLGSDKEITSHPSVNMLQEQRRSHSDIVELISRIYYEDKLIPVPSNHHSKYIELNPNANKSVAFISLTDNPMYKVEYSASQSRFNYGSFEKVKQMVSSIIQDSKDATIGVITPYKAQVNLYKKFYAENAETIGLEKEQLSVGTVHSFQGTEYDIVIFDMVDSLKSEKNIPIGNLYFHKVGEQLTNVAVSRTISKLIIVGCDRVLSEGAKRDQVSSSTKRLIRYAKELAYG